MRKYIYPSVVFLISIGIGALLYKLVSGSIGADAARLLYRALLTVVFSVLTVYYIKDTKALFKFRAANAGSVILLLLLVVLFVINNYFLAKYSSNVAYAENGSLSLLISTFIINSFFEEITYRGFLQGYINQKVSFKQMPVSQGNWYASALMLLTHLGFFFVMDVLFATTGLLLVLIYSLVAGYIRDKGGSIWFLIMMHTLVNMVHLLFNYDHYIVNG